MAGAIVGGDTDRVLREGHGGRRQDAARRRERGRTSPERAAAATEGCPDSGNESGLFPSRERGGGSGVYDRPFPSLAIRPMPDELDAVADALHAARHGGDRVPTAAVALDTIERAYRLQAALERRERSARIGFKLGATLDGAIARLALEDSFHGSLFAAHHHPSGAEIALPDDRPTSVETEFVVVIGEDIVASDGPTSAAAVRAACASVRPGFELIGTRFDMTLAGNGRHLVGDAGGNVATVLDESADADAWRSLDLRAHPARLSIDGERRAEGHSGQSRAGDPFAMVAWLLDRPAFADRGLKAGELVFCGSCTGMLPIAPGERLEADFGELGRVTATLVGTSARASA